MATKSSGITKVFKLGVGVKAHGVGCGVLVSCLGVQATARVDMDRGFRVQGAGCKVLTEETGRI